MPRIHPTAVVDPGARLASSCVIGPFCVVGPEVEIGEDCELRSHSVIESHTRMGHGNVVFPFATVGGTPQDRKFRGEATWCLIGDRNHFRENSTVHRGTANGGGKTVIGSDNLLMVGAHIAHDCVVGNQVTIANEVMLAGHIHIEDHVSIGGGAGIHHFATVGTCAFVGAMARIPRDVPPYMIIEGNPAEVRGVNSIQMSRRGFSEADIDAMKAAYRRLFGSRSERKDRSFIDAIAAIRAEFPGVAAIRKLCDDLEASAAGVHGRRLESARPDNKRSAVEHTAGAASIGGHRPG